MQRLFKRRYLKVLVVYGMAATLLFMCGFPLLFMFMTTLKPDGEIITSSKTLFTSIHNIDDYYRLFTTT